MSYSYSPTTPYYLPSSPPYGPPHSPPYQIESLKTCITYSLPCELKQQLDEQVRNSGHVCQRPNHLGEANWGHVFVSIPSKPLKSIFQNSENRNLLLKPLFQNYNYFGDGYTLGTDCRFFSLPTHITVISHLEWQRGFFELDKKVNYLSRNSSPTTKLSPLDIIYKYSNLSYLEYTKDMTEQVRENKLQHLLMFTYFKRSQFATLLPDELVQYIGSFLMFELQPQDKLRKINFKFSGLVTFAPHYVDYEKCFFLHIESEELDELRKKYGFHNKMDFVLCVGKLEHAYPCRYSPCEMDEEISFVDISNSSDKKRKLMHDDPQTAPSKEICK
ncbi:hypothetical protein C9374_009765 [Naegleria lovaniensis]|uniref:Uncharacterized protein n=1 Tax=Naegleria lovaniensis TaxID=51637 RepID=A0AA88KPJ0_NAELO|nr:uncharacterized protein C9374_009765 [Naegleria lovaniensis]KAG2393188.1 hypothetical protein C9374_009765 [Naegleria lovaniensis]